MFSPCDITFSTLYFPLLDFHASFASLRYVRFSFLQSRNKNTTPFTFFDISKGEIFRN